MRKLLSYLRIAFSAADGVLCMLLIVLWRRSYSQFDQFARLGSNRTYYGCTSAQGRILLGKSNDPVLYNVFGTSPIQRRFSLDSWDKVTNVAFFPASVSEFQSPPILPWLKLDRDFYIQDRKGSSYEITLPYGILVATLGGLAALPWLRWRFSLRTLLTAITLIAVFLGWTIYPAT